MNTISMWLVIATHALKLARELWEFFKKGRAFPPPSPSPHAGCGRGAAQPASSWRIVGVMEKVKATVYLSKDTWERAKALSDEVPGMSASKLLDGMLRQMVPQLEEMIALAKSGDVQAMVQFMDTFAATMLGSFGSEFSTVRRELLEKARKEDET